MLPPYTLKDEIGEAFVKVNPYERYQVALESANVSPVVGAVELESLRSQHADEDVTRRSGRRIKKEPELTTKRAAPNGKSSVIVKGSQDFAM